MDHTKYKCIERANSLIEEGTAVSLRYAALELRFCMEAITYEKLEASAKHIPPDIIDKWQPPQAVRALLEHEPKTDKGFTLYAGIEEEYGVPSKNVQFVGEHKAFNLGWLRKHYNKVGGFLHINHKRSKNAKLPTEEIKSYLKEVSEDISEVLKGNITGGWLDEVFQFTCSQCSKTIIVGKHTLESGRDIVCQNDNCRAEYYGRLYPEGSGALFDLKVTVFDCAQCSAEIPVENRRLKIGYSFKCSKCGTNHELVHKQWGYKAEIEVETEES